MVRSAAWAAPSWAAASSPWRCCSRRRWRTGGRTPCGSPSMLCFASASFRSRASLLSQVSVVACVLKPGARSLQSPGICECDAGRSFGWTEFIGSRSPFDSCTMHVSVHTVISSAGVRFILTTFFFQFPRINWPLYAGETGSHEAHVNQITQVVK